MATSDRPTRVLVVDDSRDIVVTMSWLLRRCGFEVGTAVDGRAAVEEAQRFRPDLVFLDIGLPVMDGFEAASLIRAALGPSPVIIAVSAYSGPENLQKAEQCGIDDYAVKPTQVSTLLEIAKAVTERR